VNPLGVEVPKTPWKNDAYDVVVSDGQYKMKCVLAPSLNHLVQNGQIRPLTTTSKLVWRRVMDETSFKAAPEPLVCILSLVLAENATDDVASTREAQWLRSDDALPFPAVRDNQQWQPMYLPLSSNSCLTFAMRAPLCGTSAEAANAAAASCFDMPDKQWRRKRVVLLEDEDTITSSITVLSALRHGDAAGRRRLGDVYCRVIKMGPVHWWGAPHSAKPFNAPPVKFTMVVADATLPRGIRVVVWGKLAVEAYSSLRVGDCVLLSEFGFKRYNDVPELSSRDESAIVVVNATAVASALSRVRVPTALQTAAIVGVLSYVGPRERSRVDDDRFVEYRYVTVLVDGNELIVLRLGAGASPEVFLDLAPGCRLVCSNARRVACLRASADEDDSFFYVADDDAAVVVQSDGGGSGGSGGSGGNSGDDDELAWVYEEHSAIKLALDDDTLVNALALQVPDGPVYVDVQRGSREKAYVTAALQPSLARPVGVFQVFASNPRVQAVPLHALEERAQGLALGEVEHVLCQGYIEAVKIVNNGRQGTATVRPVNPGRSLELLIARDASLSPCNALDDADFVSVLFPRFVLDEGKGSSAVRLVGGTVKLSKLLRETRFGLWVKLKRVDAHTTHLWLRAVLTLGNADSS